MRRCGTRSPCVVSHAWPGCHDLPVVVARRPPTAPGTPSPPGLHVPHVESDAMHDLPARAGSPSSSARTAHRLPRARLQRRSRSTGRRPTVQAGVPTAARRRGRPGRTGTRSPRRRRTRPRRARRGALSTSPARRLLHRRSMPTQLSWPVRSVPVLEAADARDREGRRRSSPWTRLLDARHLREVRQVEREVAARARRSARRPGRCPTRRRRRRGPRRPLAWSCTCVPLHVAAGRLHERRDVEEAAEGDRVVRVGRLDARDHGHRIAVGAAR